MERVNFRNRILLAAAGILFLLLSGCAKKGESTETADPTAGSYYVYYSDADNTGLVSRLYRTKSESFDGIIRELLEEFRKAPDDDVISALPGGVSINGYTRGVDDLTIDFNASYLGLSNVQEVLARAGVVKTLVQIPGVRNVSVTVDSQPLTEPDGSPVGPMNENTFVENQGDEINSYRHADLKLYFADPTGTKLVLEERGALLSSNLILERVVVENVLKGPKGPDAESLRAVCYADVPINRVYLDENICVVDLGARINEANDAAVQPEAVLYAIVNSLMDNCEIDGVRLLIDGSGEERLRSQITLDQVFGMNSDLVTQLSDREEADAVDDVADGAGI